MKARWRALQVVRIKADLLISRLGKTTKLQEYLRTFYSMNIIKRKANFLRSLITSCKGLLSSRWAYSYSLLLNARLHKTVRR